MAKAKGYDQVLWLDAAEHKYIQEVGTMNIFFKKDNAFITPKLDCSVLDGITRKSVIQLAKDNNLNYVEYNPDKNANMLVYGDILNIYSSLAIIYIAILFQ